MFEHFIMATNAKNIKLMALIFLFGGISDKNYKILNNLIISII